MGNGRLGGESANISLGSHDDYLIVYKLGAKMQPQDQTALPLAAVEVT